MTQFKLGDKVKITSIDFEVKGKLQKEDIGKICKITLIICSDYILNDNYYKANFPKNSLELVEENIESKGGKKMTQFKVGDIVRFNTNKGDVPDYYSNEGRISEDLLKHGGTSWNGENCEVLGLHNEYVAVKFLASGRDKYTCLAFDSENLILITEQKNKMTDITKFDKKAISDAVKEVDEERLDKQKENAKDILREIYSKKDTAEEGKEKLSEELKEINKELNAFTKASK